MDVLWPGVVGGFDALALAAFAFGFVLGAGVFGLVLLPFGRPRGRLPVGWLSVGVSSAVLLVDVVDVVSCSAWKRSSFRYLNDIHSSVIS